MIQGLVPDCGLLEIEQRPGKGRFLRVPKVKQRARKVREESLTVEGPMLYNSLPPVIRNFNGSLESFKIYWTNF